MFLVHLWARGYYDFASQQRQVMTILAVAHAIGIAISSTTLIRRK